MGVCNLCPKCDGCRKGHLHCGQCNCPPEPVRKPCTYCRSYIGTIMCKHCGGSGLEPYKNDCEHRMTEAGQRFETCIKCKSWRLVGSKHWIDPNKPAFRSLDLPDGYYGIKVIGGTVTILSQSEGWLVPPESVYEDGEVRNYGNFLPLGHEFVQHPDCYECGKSHWEHYNVPKAEPPALGICDLKWFSPHVKSELCKNWRPLKGDCKC